VRCVCSDFLYLFKAALRGRCPAGRKAAGSRGMRPGGRSPRPAAPRRATVAEGRHTTKANSLPSPGGQAPGWTDHRRAGGGAVRGHQLVIPSPALRAITPRRSRKPGNVSRRRSSEVAAPPRRDRDALRRRDDRRRGVSVVDNNESAGMIYSCAESHGD
jgi:hypothetical protein